jgi:hypothetical protein
LHRKFGEPAEHLYRADVFPDGAILATGTSLIPELPFSLADGDVVSIGIDGVLTNLVVRARRTANGRLAAPDPSSPCLTRAPATARPVREGKSGRESIPDQAMVRRARPTAAGSVATG